MAASGDCGGEVVLGCGGLLVCGGDPVQDVDQLLSSLADWRYDGSTAARRRLIYEFPLVALRTTTSDIADH